MLCMILDVFFYILMHLLESTFVPAQKAEEVQNDELLVLEV